MHRGHRRTFLKEIAAGSGVVALASRAGGLLAQASPDWRKQIGLELFTVRDLMTKDFEGTLAKVAEIGYKEVEPVGYGGLNPKQFRALLDRYGLSAPSTHGPAIDGPDLEQQLEGHQIMGIKYTEIRAARPGGQRPGGPPGAGGAPGARAPGAPGGPRAGGMPARPPQTEEAVKRSAEQYNKHGAIAKKFGMKILIHNHAGEFDLLENSTKTQYDVLLAETGPALVTMQIDIGWACVAGQNVLEMFKKHPGRYELWHVKDVVGLKNVEPGTPPGRRRGTFIPIGQGEIDYRAIFASARLAGLKHFVIEQDNAGQGGGDALADARANYVGLVKVLS